jgi:hypothetical protein
MDTQLAANWISLGAAITTLLVVIGAFWAILDNRKQAQKDREHAQQLAGEERRHQSRPVLVPAGDVLNFKDLPNRVAETKPLAIQNIGNGPAFNVHGALYFFNNIWYSSWNNGPFAANSSGTIVFEHGKADDIGLAINKTVDGKYHLYNDGDSQNYRPGRLTMTYRDLFGITHVSIFDYIVPAPGEHRWVQLSITPGIDKDLEDLDNERVRTWRKTKPDH